jgi:hypothetical protein
MRFFVPQGIGDSVWALHKARSIARKEGDGVVSIRLASSGSRSSLDTRAMEFIRRFSFVADVDMLKASPLRSGSTQTDGYYNYLPDGRNGVPHGADFTLMPNAALERGTRLEDWLPRYEIEWGVMSHWQWNLEEEDTAQHLAAKLGRYVVFYLGPMTGNTTEGHNRGMIWEPGHWADLGRLLHEQHGVHIVVVGASYDYDYWRKLVERRIDPSYWHCHIGQWQIGQTFSVVRRAACIVGYQSGIPIVASYLGVPTAIFWRARGDSIHPNPQIFISFNEGMASAWVQPDMLEAGKHMPLIYGRCTPGGIAGSIKEREWIK